MKIKKEFNYDGAIAISILVFVCLVFLCISASFYIIFDYYSNQRNQEAYLESIM